MKGPYLSLGKMSRSELKGGRAKAEGSLTLDGFRDSVFLAQGVPFGTPPRISFATFLQSVEFAHSSAIAIQPGRMDAIETGCFNAVGKQNLSKHEVHEQRLHDL